MACTTAVLNVGAVIDPLLVVSPLMGTWLPGPLWVGALLVALALVTAGLARTARHHVRTNLLKEIFRA